MHALGCYNNLDYDLLERFFALCYAEEEPAWTTIDTPTIP